MRKRNKRAGPREAGGAAIEYVLVSSFAAVMALAAISFVGQIIKDKLQAIEQKLGIEFNQDTEIFDP